MRVEDSSKKNKKSNVDYAKWKPELAESNDLLNVDADKVWQSFGSSWRYMAMMLLMVSAPSMMYSSLTLSMPLLLGNITDFSCVVNRDFETQYEVVDQCTVLELSNNKTRTCLELIGTATRFDYGKESEDYTITNKFNLVCEHEGQREHGSGIFLVGSMMGAPILAVFSDVRGRRKAFLLSMFMAVIINIATALSPNYTAFLGLRLVAGFALGGRLNIGYTMSSEVSAPSMREWIPVVANFFWVFGIMLAGVARMFLDNWRYIYLTCAFPGFLALIVYYKYFPESLHWQVTNKKKDDITKHLQRATFVNRKVINLKECLNESNGNAHSEEADRTQSCSMCRDLWAILRKKKTLIFHFVLSAILMIVMNLTYWALSLFSTKLSDHALTGFFMSGLIEMPAAILAVILLKVMNRRPVSATMLALTALSLAVAIFVPEYYGENLGEDGKWWISLLCPLFAKMFNSIVWSVLPLAMSEMIPTVIRTSFAGGVSLIGEVGSVVAPYLENMDKDRPNAAATLIAGLTGICAICVFMMPETKGVHLASGIDTFDEGAFLKTIRRTFSRSLSAEIPMSKDEEDAFIANGSELKINGTPNINNKKPTFFA